MHAIGTLRSSNEQSTEREYALMQHGVPLSQLSTSQLRRLLPRVGCGRRRQLRLHRPAVLPRDLRRRQRMQARQRRIPLVELRFVVRTCGRNSNTFAVSYSNGCFIPGPGLPWQID